MRFYQVYDGPQKGLAVEFNKCLSKDLITIIQVCAEKPVHIGDKG